jgi:NAD(P)-dependent dehydrogenase (short-subunit alcohol dehydrogenase family)
VTRRQTRDLRGSVVVVTGAARGLGAELSRQLAARGARVAMLGLEPEQLAAVAAQCPGSQWWEADVTDPAALTSTAAAVQECFGRVDVVVANAGIAAGGPLTLADPDTYERVIEVNLLGSVRTVRAFLPALLVSRGHVLQVASVAAIVPAPMMSAYCASKSGVEAFAHALRAEVAHHGVSVGVAYLSWTDTDMVRGADRVAGLSDLRSTLPGPLGRTYPLEPATARIVDGLARRSPHVYAQAWLRVLPALRGVFPALVARAPVADVRRAEQAVRETGVSATRAVGAGGTADSGRRPPAGLGAVPEPPAA